MDLQDRMFKISKVNIDGIELDQATWTELVQENTNFSQTISKMRQELKQLKYKEKRLIKLILTMKKLNYPVEEIYEQDVRKQRKRRKTKQI
mmetsp:Transcript_1955/g.233  ORF Transcript_1955/g.233 Transcript_1955/m.233 type:complete len:91 (+) Transcript_1955:643-915(+)